MYELNTYEKLLARMLRQVSLHNRNLDTREGSVIWYGLAPAAAEMQNLYIQLSELLNESFADTATRGMLIRRAKERGLSPYPSTPMVGKAEFTPKSLEIPMGTRFSLDKLNFFVIDKLSDGAYKVQCETLGEAGNQSNGILIPIEHIEGLETARLTEILIPGEDDEDTESFRKRYFQSLNAQAFGGNVADYIEKVSAIPGVGGVRVYRHWNGGIRPAEFAPPMSLHTWLGNQGQGIPADIRAWMETVSDASERGLLTVGGAVGLTIIDATFSSPSSELTDLVQQTIDPREHHAEGLGLAPIGHYVTVRGVTDTAIDISMRITFQSEWTWADVKPYAETALDTYFKELSQTWAEVSEPLVVRVSHIETRILSCPGVLDVEETYINGEASNFVLDADAIPVRGTVYG